MSPDTLLQEYFALDRVAQDEVLHLILRYRGSTALPSADEWFRILDKGSKKLSMEELDRLIAKIPDDQ